MRRSKYLLLGALMALFSGPGYGLGGDFSLKSSRGGEYDLKDARGKVVVLSFGYTFCPDVCPTALSTIAVALNIIGQDAANVDALFISLDPERDSVEKLREYTRFFHPGIQGLTGKPETLKEIAERYRVRYNFVGKGTREYYTLNHGANLFILDAQGELFRILPHGLPPHVLADGIRAALDEARLGGDEQ